MIKNGIQALKYILRENGYGALYNGILTSVVKSFLFLPTFYLARKIVG